MLFFQILYLGEWEIFVSTDLPFHPCCALLGRWSMRPSTFWPMNAFEGRSKGAFWFSSYCASTTIFLYSCFCFSLALLACHSTRGEWGRPPFPLPSPPFEHVSAGTARGLPSLSSIYKETSLVRCCHQWFSIYHVRAKEQFLSSQMHGLIFSFSFSKL